MAAPYTSTPPLGLVSTTPAPAALQAMDVVVGGPPGAYAPALHPLNPPERPPGAHPDDGRREPPPPLMREPPGEKLDEYQKQRCA